jgi:hypothetical protein
MITVDVNLSYNDLLKSSYRFLFRRFWFIYFSGFLWTAFAVFIDIARHTLVYRAILRCKAAEQT